MSPGVSEFTTVDLGSQSADRDCKAGLGQISWEVLSAFSIKAEKKVGRMKHLFMYSINMYSVIIALGL